MMINCTISIRLGFSGGGGGNTSSYYSFRYDIFECLKSYLGRPRVSCRIVFGIAIDFKKILNFLIFRNQRYFFACTQVHDLHYGRDR